MTKDVPDYTGQAKIGRGTLCQRENFEEISKESGAQYASVECCDPSPPFRAFVLSCFRD